MESAGLESKRYEMFLNNQDYNSEEKTEGILPHKKLRGFVEKLLKKRVPNPSDAEDIAQDVFRRSWQWADSHHQQLPLEDWKKLIAKITFNEINRFYSKKREVLLDDLVADETTFDVADNSVCPQFILEIAQELRLLPFRQRLSIVLHEGEILPYLKVVLSNRDLAELLEISEQALILLEPKIPLSESQITELIKSLTNKPCKSSIRDERSKGRKSLRRRLFGI